MPRGVLVLEPNYRGSAGYGEKFRALNVRNLGVGDAWDVLSGVDALIAKGMVDPARVGTMGWSQGGYISAFLATHDAARFKAISVGAGISDWMTYYVNTDITPFTRQYLKATPWDDPEIYAKTSPITYIKQAKTPTLIQHGATDQRVPLPNAFELYHGLQDNHVPTKLIVYQGFGGVGHGPIEAEEQSRDDGPQPRVVRSVLLRRPRRKAASGQPLSTTDHALESASRVRAWPALIVFRLSSRPPRARRSVSDRRKPLNLPFSALARDRLSYTRSNASGPPASVAIASATDASRYRLEYTSRVAIRQVAADRQTIVTCVTVMNGAMPNFSFDQYRKSSASGQPRGRKVPQMVGQSRKQRAQFRHAGEDALRTPPVNGSASAHRRTASCDRRPTRRRSPRRAGPA